VRPEFLNDEIRDLFNEGKLSRIVTRCQDILGDLRATHGNLHVGMAPVLDELARAYFELHDYQAAIEVTKQLLKMDSMFAGEANADFARSIANLGVLYLHAHRIAEAELALDRALELVKRLPLDEQWLHSSVLINLASVYREQCDFARAERLLVDAAKLRLESHGWLDPKFGVVFRHLSRLYLRMESRIAAERALRKAMRIYQGASHTENSEYAGMLASLGSMLARQGKNSDARTSYCGAVSILRRVRPEGSPHVAEIERRISQLEVEGMT
jgi:tetratricopeptide (TPR) repeat protein